MHGTKDINLQGCECFEFKSHLVLLDFPYDVSAEDCSMAVKFILILKQKKKQTLVWFYPVYTISLNNHIHRGEYAFGY